MLDTTPAHHHPGTDPGQDEPGIYEIFLRDVVMPFRIGVYPSEYKAPQRVRIDLDLDVRQDRATLTDDISDVVSYDDIMHNLRQIAAGEHINLLEVLAERIGRPVPGRSAGAARARGGRGAGYLRRDRHSRHPD
jgi:dihydroneopterin aldolase